MSSDNTAVLGKGIYTIGAAARLARVSRARLTRWVAGYERQGVEYPALWSPDFKSDERNSVSVLSFADLMEAIVISAFAEHGVQIRTVRRAIEMAREKYDLERPFSSEIFETDGKNIFMELREYDPDDSGLIDIVNSQRAFKNIVKPAFKNIEFSHRRAARWWPLGKSRGVLVDPSISLGAPIVSKSGVPIDALVSALPETKGEMPSESEVRSVARLYDVSNLEVRNAAFFNLQFAA